MQAQKIYIGMLAHRDVKNEDMQACSNLRHIGT